MPRDGGKPRPARLDATNLDLDEVASPRGPGETSDLEEPTADNPVPPRRSAARVTLDGPASTVDEASDVGPAPAPSTLDEDEEEGIATEKRPVASKAQLKAAKRPAPPLEAAVDPAEASVKFSAQSPAYVAPKRAKRAVPMGADGFEASMSDGPSPKRPASMMASASMRLQKLSDEGKLINLLGTVLSVVLFLVVAWVLWSLFG